MCIRDSTYDIWMEPRPRTTTGKIRRHQIEKRLREEAVTAEAAEARPLSPEETTWLQTPAHAAAMATISARIPQVEVRPDANLDLDLALDSMERVELLSLIEQQHGRRVAPEARATIFTVRQLVDAVLVATPTAGAATDATVDQSDHSNQMWETLLNQPPDPEHLAQLSRSTFGRALIFYVLIRIIRPFFRLRASGQQHIPQTGPYILSPNHQSYLDAFLMLGVVPFRTLRQVFAVGAAEYYQTPVSSTHLTLPTSDLV